MVRNDAQHRLFKVAFGTMALVCLLVGLSLCLIAERFGLDAETARYVAIAFPVASVGD